VAARPGLKIGPAADNPLPDLVGSDRSVFFSICPENGEHGGSLWFGVRRSTSGSILAVFFVDALPQTFRHLLKLRALLLLRHPIHALDQMNARLLHPQITLPARQIERTIGERSLNGATGFNRVP